MDNQDDSEIDSEEVTIQYNAHNDNCLSDLELSPLTLLSVYEDGIILDGYHECMTDDFINRVHSIVVVVNQKDSASIDLDDIIVTMKEDNDAK